MKDAAKKSLKIFKAIFLLLIASLFIFFVVRAIGKNINSAAPEGGINESLYLDINGAKQWINIYGEDVDNPVLLYLHGGPGSATSEFDYVITRKWADVYTVVTWDQRNCGKSYDPGQNQTALTRELLMRDGLELTEFLLERLDKEKITILGHSWGSIYGANLVLEYPQYYECFIGTGQLVDIVENEEAFRQAALLWAGDDAEALRLVAQLTPENLSLEHITATNALMQKYGYSMMENGADYNLAAAVIFNPNYSIADWIRYFQRDPSVYLDFFVSDEFRSFSIKGRTKYEIPYYNINGDKDYQTNYQLAELYFDQIDAPDKRLFMMENMTHGLLESRSEEFSEIVHTIAQMETSRLR